MKVICKVGQSWLVVKVRTQLEESGYDIGRRLSFFQKDLTSLNLLTVLDMALQEFRGIISKKHRFI